MATTIPAMPLETPTKRQWGNIATVTLIVGETKTTFHVHEAELCEASPVFKAAFSSNFKESSERKMNLPEDDAELFNLLIEWLYGHRYDLPQPIGDKTKDGTRFMEAMRLYVLADKYGVAGLKSCIAKTIFNTMKDGNVTGPNIDTVAFAYQNVPQTSGIRKLLADLYACNINFEWYERATTKARLQKNPEFATDVILSFVQHTSRKCIDNPFKGDMPEIYQE